MAHDVFISHAEEDKQVAGEVCRALEEQGVKCWIAPRDVPPGVHYEQAILDAIEESRFLVLIFSAHANASRHVEREIRKASEDCSQTQVLPFRLENIPYNKVLYYYLGGAQWVDAWANPPDDGVRLLVKHVRARLDEAKGAASVAAKSEAAARPLVTDAGDVRVSKEETEETTEDEHTLRGANDGPEKIPREWLAAAGAMSLFVVVAVIVTVVYLPGGDSDNSNAVNVNSNLAANGNANVAPPLTPTPTATRPATRPTPTQTMTPQPPADTDTQPQPGGAGEALDARRAHVIMNNLYQHPGLRDVSVTVKGGMATLSGQVYSSSCREAAASVVSQSGVRLRANNIKLVKAPINTPRERVSCREPVTGVTS